MSFQQSWMLYALPVIALPIIIHLINQRRFQSIQWAAMMFLLAAHRMSRGYSKLRQWLILFFRTLAVAGLIFAVSRPLSSGWLGFAAGNRADTTIVLLDRSPSMAQRGSGTGESKLETGKKQLVNALQTLGSNRFVLIDSATNEPRELESPSSLMSIPSASTASNSADLPRMLQAAHDYIRDNRSGRTEIWICSDLRENDWSADSGRWSTLRDAFQAFPQGVRFHLLAYPQSAASNVAIRVTDVKRHSVGELSELIVSLRLTRPAVTDDSRAAANESDKVIVPVQFEVEGARSVVNVELTGSATELKEHRLPIDKSKERGWGRVSIPADANPADDDFYFSFDNPPPRRSVLVAEDQQIERPLQLVSSISPDPTIKSSAEIVQPEQLGTLEWEQIALVLWQGPLPSGANAALMQTFIDRGGQVVFFPPRNPGNEVLFGMKWKSWNTGNDPVPVEMWRSDADALARTISGSALPVGQLEIRRYCDIEGEATSLASLKGGASLLVRVPTERGGAYFWTTTPAPQDSSLAQGGVVLYAFVQRVLNAGSAVLAKTKLLDAGPSLEENPGAWSRLSEGDAGLSTEYPFHRGVYSEGERILAVNRPQLEDNSRVLGDARISELFQGLDFVRVDDQAGSLTSLIQEIWRVFLATMLAALVLEAILCMPKQARPAAETVNGLMRGAA